jgi:iron complex outermembrane recepter protein
VQAQWQPERRLLLSAGGRYDALRFAVRDDFLSDGGVNGGDNSGARQLPAYSGHAGVSWLGGTAFSPYANIATSFETPTTTELQVRPDRQGGFNPDLGPQRTVSLEIGARGAAGTRLTWNLAAYRARVRNAIVQSRVTDGTAFFENAGETEHTGIETGASARLGRFGALNAAYTVTKLEFTTYRPRTGTRVDTLDGKQVPGVPREQLRLGLRSATWRGGTVDVDHTWTSSLFADDANTLRIPGWGRGVMNARVAWTGSFRGQRFEPFAGLQNALNQAYIGAVTTNGAGGRVIEPAPRRTWYIGLELGTAR